MRYWNQTRGWIELDRAGLENHWKTKERKQMNPPMKQAPKIPAKVLWRSADGKYVVISCPVPPNIVRSLTRPTLAAAAKTPVRALATRGGAPQVGFVKTLAEYVVEIPGEENEWGEVCP